VRCIDALLLDRVERNELSAERSKRVGALGAALYNAAGPRICCWTSPDPSQLEPCGPSTESDLALLARRLNRSGDDRRASRRSSFWKSCLTRPPTAVENPRLQQSRGPASPARDPRAFHAMGRPVPCADALQTPGGPKLFAAHSTCSRRPSASSSPRPRGTLRSTRLAPLLPGAEQSPHPALVRAGTRAPVRLGPRPPQAGAARAPPLQSPCRPN